MAKKITPPAILPNWVPRQELSRPTAEQINRAENRKKTLTYEGYNEVIPIVYGEQLVSGPVIAGPHVSGSYMNYAVALCYAGEAGIEDALSVTIGDETKGVTGYGVNVDFGASSGDSGAAITVRVYDGTQTLPCANLTGVTDAFEGIAYASVRVSTAGAQRLSNMNALRVRIRGRRLKRKRDEIQYIWELAPVQPPWPHTGAASGIDGTAQAYPDSDEFVIFGRNLSENSLYSSWEGWRPPPSPINYTQIFGSTATRMTAFPFRYAYYSAKSQAPSGGWRLSGEMPGALIPVASSTSMTSHSIVVTGARGTYINRNNGAGGYTYIGEAPEEGGKVTGVTVTSSGYWFSTKSGTIWKMPFGGNTFADDSAGFGSSSVNAMCFMSDENDPVSPTNKLIAVGNDGKVAYNDGTGWTQIDAGFGTSNVTHAVWAFGAVWALAANGRIRMSEDGVSWSTVNDASDFDGLFQAGQYLAATTGGQRELWRINVPEYIYSENPALHMRDFVENDEFGLGVKLKGAYEAAAACDELYAGMPRARTGLTIQDSYEEAEILSLLASYAEVLYGYDGRDVVIVPDTPVTTTHQISRDDIREGSLKLDTVGLRQIPTRVQLMFTDRDSPEWASRPAVSEVPEHSMHGMAQMISSVSLSGVYRREEAERRAYQRLMRLQSGGRVEWQMLASGLPYEAGDVVQLPDIRGLEDVRVRLMSQPEMVAPLIFQMRGEIYDSSHYPVFRGGTAIPVGGIVIWNGTGAPPTGWQEFDMGGRLVRGGPAGPQGSAQTVSISGTTNTQPNHTGTTPSSWYPVRPYAVGTPGDNSSTASRISAYISGANMTAGAHHHQYNATINFEGMFNRQQFRFARKATEAGLMQEGMAFFSDVEQGGKGVAAVNSYNGRYLKGGATTEHEPITVPVNHYILTSIAGAHRHGPIMGANYSQSSSSHTIARMSATSRGEHLHTITATATASLRAKALAMFQATAKDTLIPTGGIIGWEGEDAPVGWALCDGSNGTIDLRNYFIYIDHIDNVGTVISSESAGTLVVSEQTSYAGSHNHYQPLVQLEAVYDPPGTPPPLHGNNAGGHRHTIAGGTEDVDLSDITRYQLRFIQFMD